MGNNNQIPVAKIVEQVKEQYDVVAEVHVSHIPTATDVSQLIFTVHGAGATSYEEYLDDFDEYDWAVVDVGDDKPMKLPFTVVATACGPGHLQGQTGTTLYLAEDVTGSDARSLDDGMMHFRKKLSGTCPSCGESVPGIHEHHVDNQTCREEERV
jgi:hypothetical protein